MINRRLVEVRPNPSLLVRKNPIKDPAPMAKIPAMSQLFSIMPNLIAPAVVQ